MGAVANLQRKSFISLIYLGSPRSLYVIGPTETCGSIKLRWTASSRLRCAPNGSGNRAFGFSVYTKSRVHALPAETCMGGDQAPDRARLRLTVGTTAVGSEMMAGNSCRLKIASISASAGRISKYLRRSRLGAAEQLQLGLASGGPFEIADSLWLAAGRVSLRGNITCRKSFMHGLYFVERRC